MEYNSHNIYAWIACHVNTLLRPTLLKWCVESLLLGDINNIDISISFYDGYSSREKTELSDIIVKFMNELERKYNHSTIVTLFWDVPMQKNNGIIKRTPSLKFEHYQYLYNKFNGSPTDVILFMNDDDLFLGLPDDIYESNKNVIRGLAYVSDKIVDNKTDKMNIHQLLKVKDNMKHNWSEIIGLSGYMTEAINLRQYFSVDRKEFINIHENTPSESLKNLIIEEDQRFMFYLDKINSIHPKTPFIFHRLWEAADIMI
jgi:hypothetical protein